MDVKQAKELLEEKSKTQKEELEAHRVIEQDRLRQIKEREEVDRESLKKAREDLKARFPRAPGKTYMKCWKCKKALDMGQAEVITKGNVQIFRVIECKCNAINIEYITLIDAKIISKYDGLLNQLTVSTK